MSKESCPKCGFVEEGELKVDMVEAAKKGIVRVDVGVPRLEKNVTQATLVSDPPDTFYLKAICEAAKPFEARVYYCSPGEADLYIELRFGCTDWLLARKDFTRCNTKQILYDSYNWVVETSKVAREAVSAAMKIHQGKKIDESSRRDLYEHKPI